MTYEWMKEIYTLWRSVKKIWGQEIRKAGATSRGLLRNKVFIEGYTTAGVFLGMTGQESDR